METGRPSRREDTRARVLAAVAAILRRKGYASLTIEGVAEQSGVAKTTINPSRTSSPLMEGSFSFSRLFCFAYWLIARVSAVRAQAQIGDRR